MTKLSFVSIFFLCIYLQNKLNPLSLDLGDNSINRSSEGIIDLESLGQPDMMTPDEAEQLLSTK